MAKKVSASVFESLALGRPPIPQDSIDMPEEAETVAETANAEPIADQSEDMHDSMHAAMAANEANTEEVKVVAVQEASKALQAIAPPKDVVKAVYRTLGHPATRTAGVRFSEEEMADLRLAAANLTNEYGIKIGIQDIVRLGAAVLLYDHEHMSGDGVLGAYLARKKRSALHEE